VGIYEHIGRQPILTLGNSDEDMQMIEYANAGEGRRLYLPIPKSCALFHHEYVKVESPFVKENLQFTPIWRMAKDGRKS
jgi:hypothetical protein